MMSVNKLSTHNNSTYFVNATIKIANITIKIEPRKEAARTTTFVEGADGSIGGLVSTGVSQKPETFVNSLLPSQLFA